MNREQEHTDTRIFRNTSPGTIADFRHAGMNRREDTIALLDHIKDIVLRCRPGVTSSDLGIEYDPLGIDDAQMSSDKENAHINENNFEKNHVPPLSIWYGTEQISENGPGDTGKTYLYNTLITTVLNDILQLKTVAVAWTGIAAILLRGGTTVHRAFKLLLTLYEDTTCGLTMQSTQTKNIRDKVATLVRHKVRSHESCRSKYNITKLQRTRKRKVEPEENANSSTKFTRQNVVGKSSVNSKDICYSCVQPGQADKSLCTASTFCLQVWIFSSTLNFTTISTYGYCFTEIISLVGFGSITDTSVTNVVRGMYIHRRILGYK
ncbi:hypothetical protein JTB14_014140 [Gonioctena quinquepunctata]|nr:hypothetical protein JTB14_014140 [Gonioctena quinquepunctata]